MKNKIKTISFIFLFFGLILVIGGGTYAFFNFNDYSDELVTSNGQVYMKMNKSNTDIILNNVFPETYNEALYVNGENGTLRTDNVIEFTVIGKNTYDDPVYYEIDLEYGDNINNKTRIDDKYLKFELLDITDPNNINEIFSNISFEFVNDKKIYSDAISDTDISYSKTYRLRMWYDENIIISDTDPEADFKASNNEYQTENSSLPLYTEQFASIKVKVYGDFIEKVNPYAETPATCFTYINNGNNISISGYDESCGSEVRIPKRIEGLPVTEIGDAAFQLCSTITSVVIPDTVTFIDEYAFSFCDNLESINIPRGVTSLEYCVFCYCTSLVNIEIPNNITNIGEMVFVGCSNLLNINIPNSVTSIGPGAFYDCTGLTEFIIPSSVTSLGDNVFTNCSGLTSIIIPNTVTEVGHYVFTHTGIKDVYVSWNDFDNVTFGTYVIDYDTEGIYTINLHIPAGKRDLYTSHTAWSLFNIIEDNN